MISKGFGSGRSKKLGRAPLSKLGAYAMQSGGVASHTAGRFGYARIQMKGDAMSEYARPR
jgi:hypothetical protein